MRYAFGRGGGEALPETFFVLPGGWLHCMPGLPGAG